MYGHNPIPSEVRRAMQVLKDKGIAKVVIEFSGGNDEGGADGTSYLDAGGKRVEGIGNSPAFERRYYRGGKEHNDGWVVYDRSLSDDYNKQYRPATEDEKAIAAINRTLEAPIYDRFGSFAGEFSVYGTLTWDVTTGTHKMEGQESHEVWESF